MKKEFRKKFYLVAMIASLALLCGGGVTSCSNGNDDDSDVNTEDTGTTGVAITFDEDEKEVKKASEIPEKATSIKITVTGITGETSGDWWFWAKTDAGDDDKIEWKSGEAENAIYELTVSDETKIAYIKENGLYINGASGLSAKVSVSITESTDNSAPPGGNTGSGGNTSGGNNDNDETGGDTEIDKGDGTKLKSEKLTVTDSPVEFISATDLASLTIGSLTITATNAEYTGDSKDTWSFKIYTSAEWKDETILDWSEDINIYTKTLSGEDLAKFKESGIFFYGWPTGLTATVTVTYK